MKVRPSPCPLGFVVKNGVNSFAAVSGSMDAPLLDISKDAQLSGVLYVAIFI